MMGDCLNLFVCFFIKKIYFLNLFIASITNIRPSPREINRQVLSTAKVTYTSGNRV